MTSNTAVIDQNLRVEAREAVKLLDSAVQGRPNPNTYLVCKLFLQRIFLSYRPTETNLTDPKVWRKPTKLRIQLSFKLVAAVAICIN